MRYDINLLRDIFRTSIFMARMHALNGQLCSAQMSLNKARYINELIKEELSKDSTTKILIKKVA